MNLPTQRFRPLRRIAFRLLVTALLSGCSPTVVSTLPPGAAAPGSLALLPSDYSVDIPRERINLVRQSIINQLRNTGFIVLDDAAVNAICSAPQCPERAQLSERYLVDGFATLSLSTFSRNNFIAGYYNQLSGGLSIADRQGREILSVKATEDEEGGLLLQSGQIFQAIISSVQNTGDSAFEKLSDKFAHTVVEQLPPPSSPAMRVPQEGAAVALTVATATWVSPSAYRVCARGTPNSFGYLVRGSTRATLREVSPGSYCGNFSGLVTEDAAHPAIVELRSAFGTSARQDVGLPTVPPCNLAGRVTSAAGLLTVQCARVGSKEPSGCSAGEAPCSADRIVLFAATSPNGAFEKISEARSPTAALPQAAANLQVMAVGPGGIPSLPAKVEAQ